MGICTGVKRLKKKNLKLIEIYFVNSFTSELFQARAFPIWVAPEPPLTGGRAVGTARRWANLSRGGDAGTSRAAGLEPARGAGLVVGKQRWENRPTWPTSRDFDSCVNFVPLFKKIICVSSISPVYFPVKYKQNGKMKRIQSFIENEVISEVEGPVYSIFEIRSFAETYDAGALPHGFILLFRITCFHFVGSSLWFIVVRLELYK